MELNQLRYFVAVVEEGSFTRAAASVHVSQSGVSAQIRRLERELGQPLFDRSDRRVRLTDAGVAALPFARAALSSVDDVRGAVDDVTGLLRGSVRVGMVTGCSIPAFLDALAELHRRHPGLSVALGEGPSDALQRDVLGGDLDVALVGFAGAPVPGLAVHVVVDEPLAAVVPLGHGLAHRRSVRRRDLVGQTLIGLTPGTGIRAAYDATRGVAPSIDLEASSPDTVLGLVRRGLGVGVLSTSMASGSDDLVAIALTPAVRSQLGVVWRSSAPSSTASTAVLAALRAAFPEGPGRASRSAR